MDRRPEPEQVGEPGVLRRVDPRQVWPHGPYEFAPWLEQRPELVGDAIGADVVLRVDPRLPVGLIAGETSGAGHGFGRRLVVLSQLGRADESHLGRLLAGAKTVDADVAVWIALTLPSEHREVLRWLGEHTDLELFGLELEILAIDDSRPAVGLDVVASPPDWEPDEVAATSTAAGPARVAPRVPPPSGQLRITREEGESQGMPMQRIGLRVDLGDPRYNETAIERLIGERDQIERECGEPLVWERCADTGGGWLGMERAADDSDIEDWSARWQERLETVLGPRTREIASILSLGEGGGATTLPGA